MDVEKAGKGEKESEESAAQQIDRVVQEIGEKRKREAMEREERGLPASGSELPGNRGSEMLKKMGWKEGEGLGKSAGREA